MPHAFPDADDDFNAAALALPELDPVAAVIAELYSGYGDRSSSSGAYKSVESLSLESHRFDPLALDMVATIGVTSDHQSPHGHNATYTTKFELTRKEMDKLADTAPGGWRGQFAGINARLDAEYATHGGEIAAAREKQRLQGIADTTQQMAKLAQSVTAPKAATFSKKRG